MMMQLPISINSAKHPHSCDWNLLIYPIATAAAAAVVFLSINRWKSEEKLFAAAPLLIRSIPTKGN
jgi:hypothetical protein